MNYGIKSFWRIPVYFFIVIGAWIPLAWALANYLIIEKPLAKANVILVLGGSSVYIERTQKAALVYKEGAAAKILLTDDSERTGWSRTEQRNVPVVEMARRNLIAQGVPAENIEIIKPDGSGTIYEARILREKARENNWQSILIVTSAYHTRRALQTFEKVLVNDNIQIGIAAPPPGQQTPPPFYWWLTIRGWDMVAGEYVKSFYYWVYY